MPERLSKKLKYLLFLLAALASLGRPLLTSAEITLDYARRSGNPVPTQNDYNLITQAIHLLAGDHRIANHPIRRYLHDPNLLAPIIFDNVRVTQGARVDNEGLHFRSGEGLDYYIRFLIHEFIHIDMADRYNKDLNYSFLRPEDTAFQNVMEEAFAQGLEMWGRLTYPEMLSDRQVRNWRQQRTNNSTADAMRNDLRATYPHYSDEQINAMVAGEIFNMFMTYPMVYSLQHVPRNMENQYGELNSFLIPEYAAYRERGDALLRHQWNYLASIMPFQLPANMTYDHFRGRFMSDVTRWAARADRPENSILYWINFDAAGAARARLARVPEHERYYDFLSREDEQRLNRVFQEIDPRFVPVDTARTSLQRLIQDNIDFSRQQQNRGR